MVKCTHLSTHTHKPILQVWKEAKPGESTIIQFFVNYLKHAQRHRSSCSHTETFQSPIIYSRWQEGKTTIEVPTWMNVPRDTGGTSNHWAYWFPQQSPNPDTWGDFGWHVQWYFLYLDSKHKTQDEKAYKCIHLTCPGKKKKKTKKKKDKDGSLRLKL